MSALWELSHKLEQFFVCHFNLCQFEKNPFEVLSLLQDIIPEQPYSLHVWSFITWNILHFLKVAEDLLILFSQILLEYGILFLQLLYDFMELHLSLLVIIVLNRCFLFEGGYFVDEERQFLESFLLKLADLFLQKEILLNKVFLIFDDLLKMLDLLKQLNSFEVTEFFLHEGTSFVYVNLSSVIMDKNIRLEFDESLLIVHVDFLKLKKLLGWAGQFSFHDHPQFPLGFAFSWGHLHCGGLGNI